MKDIDKQELEDLKKKRQAQLLKENPPSRIIQVIEDEYNRLEESNLDSGIVTPNKKSSINLNSVIDNDSSDDETFIRLGKLKINGMWEVMVTIGATIFAIVGAWINFDMTLSKHTEQIRELQSEIFEYKKDNSNNVSMLYGNMETRISSIEKQLLGIINTMDKYDYRYTQEMTVLQNDLTILKQASTRHNSDITELLRDLNRIEGKVSGLTK